MNIQIHKVDETDREKLRRFYLLTITDTFAKNGINDPEGIIGEVDHQMEIFNHPGDLLFLATNDGEFIGTIAYGTMNTTVSNNIPNNLQHLKEIKGVYVHPEFQNRGIGSQLWHTIIDQLKKNAVEEVCLDSGYKISQQFWKKKIGEPTFFMKDYWGEGEHQMVWVFRITDVL